ncbi:hypothetical protein LOY38_14715 [Pseudomonas sp. B21-015]|uniref:hypothetical protein n=1 Tax=Pseudomonas sp. B21-015 TaxID=2895473 RepID=UPI00216036BC|nr:hypothetical protein [Pseudomonas sp. B21-015]UVM47700.1 hypothetical protein LOY38_14715 [Pseudomonas sp. B21-015]
MELVTLAHITLNRIGSANASGFGFGGHRERKFTTEVADSTIATLQQIVVEIAEANGELSGALHNLCEEQNYGYQAGQVVFNVQGINTQYSTPYAVCQAFPALKIGNRYFQLEEIETKGSTFFRPDAED